MLYIDGSQGEGGGQVLRTCLSLSALTGRPFRLEHVRANRAKPGLRPQHLTAVRAVAAICNAELRGDALNSQTLEFRPQTPPQAGSYRFDVTEAAQGGSAGAVMLIFQALLWPLLFAGAPSHLTLRGGTHNTMSPPYHYVAEVVRPVYARVGARFQIALNAWGWYPVGGGEVTAVIQPAKRLQAIVFQREPFEAVRGVAAVTNLPAHIPQRMERRAHNLLTAAGMKSAITPLRESGAGPGAGLFLWLPQAGFSSLGRPGLPAENVAEAAVGELLAFVNSSGMVDRHLADQLLLPLALAKGESSYTTDVLTLHTTTAAQLLEQWLDGLEDVTITIDGELGGPAGVQVEGCGFPSKNS
jgi:RNA 3'-terminal phosphate cyclase (ATP)